MSLPTALHNDFIRDFHDQEPWATQVKPYLAAYGRPKILSFCFAGIDSNSLWSMYEEQNLTIAEL